MPVEQENLLQGLARGIPLALAAAADVGGRGNVSGIVQSLLPPSPEEQMMLDLRKQQLQSGLDRDKLAGQLGLAREERLGRKEGRKQEEQDRLSMLNETLAKSMDVKYPGIGAGSAVRAGETGLAGVLINAATRSGAKPFTEKDFVNQIIDNDLDLNALNQGSKEDKAAAVSQATELAKIYRTDASDDFKTGMLTIFEDTKTQDRVLASQKKTRKDIYGSDAQGSPVFKNKTDAKAFMRRIKEAMGDDMIFKLRKQDELDRFVREELFPFMHNHLTIDEITNELLGLETGRARSSTPLEMPLLYSKL